MAIDDVKMEDIISISSNGAILASSVSTSTHFSNDFNSNKSEAMCTHSNYEGEKQSFVDCIGLLENILTQIGLMCTQIIKEGTETENQQKQNNAL